MQSSDYVCYCDGAFSSSRQQTGSGIAIFRNDKLVLSYCKSFKGGSNNVGELSAIILALSCFKQPVDSIKIISDSMYCVGTITGKYSINTNYLLWKAFSAEYARVKTLCNNIKIEWVRGHAGNLGNELADKLAVKASQTIN